MLKSDRNKILRKLFESTQPDTVYGLASTLHEWDSACGGDGKFVLAVAFEQITGKGDDYPINVANFIDTIKNSDTSTSITTLELLLQSYHDVMTEYLENDVFCTMMAMDNENNETTAWHLYKEMSDKVEFLSNHIKLLKIYEDKCGK